MMNNSMNNDMMMNNNNNNESSSSILNEGLSYNIKKEGQIIKINLNVKDDIMKIINTQDFNNGFWEINEYTEIIKEKYKKEYELLKGKNNNRKDTVVITI